jgi:hypothetical protein
VYFLLLPYALYICIDIPRSIAVSVEKFYLEFLEKTSKHKVQSSYGLTVIPVSQVKPTDFRTASPTDKPIAKYVTKKVTEITADARTAVCCYGRFPGTAINILPSRDEILLWK